MTELTQAHEQELAYLAGGPVRCIDTAIVRLVEGGSVRASRSGRLAVVSEDSTNDVETAVLRALGRGKATNCLHLRAELVSGAAVQILVAALVRQGTLRPSHGSWLRRFSPRAGATPAGLSMLREHRLAGRSGASRSAALAVALGGPRALPDVDLRHAIFGTRATRGRSSGRGNRRMAGSAAMGGVFWSGDGVDGGGGWGSGGGSCGGGGGCGGGG